MDDLGLKLVKDILTPCGATRFSPDHIDGRKSERYLTIGLGKFSTAYALNALENAGLMENDLARDMGGPAMYEPRFVVVPSGEVDSITLEDKNHFNHSAK